MRLLPAMLPHGEGRIVMTSSVMGLISTPGRGAYAASKYALEAWSDALRMELRHSGIKVSLIEPGPIRTRFTDNVNQTQSDKPVEKSWHRRPLYVGTGSGGRQSAPCFY